jgi:hypothetical protein
MLEGKVEKQEKGAKEGTRVASVFQSVILVKPWNVINLLYTAKRGEREAAKEGLENPFASVLRLEPVRLYQL